MLYIERKSIKSSTILLSLSFMESLNYTDISCIKTPLISQKEPDSDSKSRELEQSRLKFNAYENIRTPSLSRSMLDSPLKDRYLDCDFRILSPLANFPSPQTPTYYNYTQKEKGLISPLRNMQNESPISFSAATDEWLENYQAEEYNPKTMNNSGVRTSLQCYDDVLSFQGSSAETSEPGGSNQVREEKNINVDEMGSNINTDGPLASMELQQEQYQQEEPHQCHTNSLMMPFGMGPDQEQDGGLQLVHLLLSCADAVSKEDYMSARRYIHHLNQVSTPLGNSMQRVASCFTDALSARLASTLTTPKPPTSTKWPMFLFQPNSLEITNIYQIVYQACPFIKFAFFTANQAILEAFEFEQRVHIIDLGIVYGYQWPAFMQALSVRPGGPPFLRITGVGPIKEKIKEVGRCLTELAHSLNIPFKFHAVGEQLEDLEPHMLNRHVGDALAINSICVLHHMHGNSQRNLLTIIRDQAPNIVTLVEQEASLNGSYFLGRFLEALHFFSAIFDSLDATFPVDSAQRMKVEQGILAPEVRNIVACEGNERVKRFERLEKWRKVMEGKGLKNVALSENCMLQSKILLGLHSCDGYRLTEDNGCLLLGWQERPLLSSSAWRC